MADSTVSIWFDLQVATGTGDKLTPQSKGGLDVTKVAIASIIVRNVYVGDFQKGSGKAQPMGFWDWIPRCVSEAEKVCSYPLPDHWKKPLRGGWHWGEVEKHWKKSFLSLSKDTPMSKKIGAIADFKVEDFRGYNPKEIKSRNIATFGHWVINDGQLNLSGTWQFVRLM